MAWRLAGSLYVLRCQVNEAWPKRDRSSDGTIGDEAHTSRDSDHNAWVPDWIRLGRGVVTALDIDDDKASGCDADAIAEAIRRSMDPRVKYIISEARIARSYAKPGIAAWAWAPYTGINAHRHHVHISVQSEPKFYDDPVPWRIR